MTLTRLIASTLCVLLVSCGATRSTVAPAAGELTRYVLVLEESPGGQVTEHWRPAGEFELSWYRLPSSARESTYGRIVRVAKTYQRDCDAENDQCIEMCMSRPLPRGFGHIRSGEGVRVENGSGAPTNADKPTMTAGSWSAAKAMSSRPWMKPSTG